MLVSGRLKEKNRGVFCLFYEIEKWLEREMNLEKT